MSYNTKNYTEQGGARRVVASGGSLDVESGGEIDIESGGSLKLAGTAISATAAELNKVDGIAATAYHTVTEGISFTEGGSATSLTGTVEIPAGAILLDITVLITVLFDDSGAVTMIVGDDDDDNGWFTGINMKATDLLVGEILSIRHGDLWGGKEGAYLVAATGRRGRVTAGVDSGTYYGAASEVIGAITLANGDGSAGRAFMFVTYAVPTVVAATAA